MRVSVADKRKKKLVCQTDLDKTISDRYNNEERIFKRKGTLGN